MFPDGILQGNKACRSGREQRTVALTYLCSRRDPTGRARAFLACIYLGTEIGPLTNCRIRHSPPADPRNRGPCPPRRLPAPRLGRPPSKICDVDLPAVTACFGLFRATIQRFDRVVGTQQHRLQHSNDQ